MMLKATLTAKTGAMVVMCLKGQRGYLPSYSFIGAFLEENILFNFFSFCKQNTVPLFRITEQNKLPVKWLCSYSATAWFLAWFSHNAVLLLSSVQPCVKILKGQGWGASADLSVDCPTWSRPLRHTLVCFMWETDNSVHTSLSVLPSHAFIQLYSYKAAINYTVNSCSQLHTEQNVLIQLL